MMMNVLKVFITSLCAFILQACDDDGSASDNVNPTPRCEENDPNCEIHGTRSTPIIHDYSFEEYADGQVVEFHWTQTLDWFLPHEEHKWGFDMDPYALFSEDAVFHGRDVYMSVSDGEFAQINILVNCDAKDRFSLRKIDKDNSTVLTGKEACSEGKDGMIKKSLSAGDYAIYYGDEEQKRYLHIKSYRPDLNREIFFVKFGNEKDPDCIGGDGKTGCYTKDIVEKYFDKVMAQVVVGGDFKSVEPSEVGFDEGPLLVDLTNSLSEVYSFITTSGYAAPIVAKIKTDVLLNSNFGIKDKKEKLTTETQKIIDKECSIMADKEQKENLKNSISNKKSDCERIERSTNCQLSDEGDSFTISCPQDVSSEDFQEYKSKCGDWLSYKKYYDDEEKRCNNDVSDYNSAKNDYDSALEKAKEKHLVFGINEMRVNWNFDGNGGNSVILKNYSSFVTSCKYADDCSSSSNEMTMKMKNSCSGGETSIRLKVIDVLTDDSFKASISGHKKGCKYSIYKDVYPHVPGLERAAQLTLPSTKSESDKTVIGGFVWGCRLTGEASMNTIVHEIGHSFGLTDLYIWPDDPTNPRNYEGYCEEIDESGICLTKYADFAFDEANLMNYSSPNGMRLRYRPLAVAKTIDGELIDKKGSSGFETEKQWDCIRSSVDCFKEKN
ncbi:hypothetical protein SAMN05720487_12423 [Fibrobacter sp. UWT2]|uniref:hypothetical protein n=1 Tax=Fibrobacter sp. UWT2 TaxID=1896224 RepID=UPI00091B710C|nr:hypothetical protein [Fibrobacter sp. UWT2]SHL73535.1 hypothetical protein SAMN05720487_12423 [Fibrobacter sp. UWT2]